MTAKAPVAEHPVDEADLDEIEVSAEPILDMDELAPKRPCIKYHGKIYELALMDDFGVEEQQQAKADGEEFDKLWNADSLTENEKARLKMLLDRMFERVLKAPANIKEEMGDSSRMRVVTAFTLAPLAQAAERAQKEEQEATEKEKGQIPTTEK